MIIFYQVYNNWTIKQKAILTSYGFEAKNGYYSIDVVDNEQNQPLFRMMDDWGVEKFCATQFEEDDFDKSSLFVLVGFWQNGYPQPESVEEYRRATYDLTNYCDECGIGGVQNAPFRIKVVPKWRNKKIFELTWVQDEFFVKRDVYETVFLKKYNLDCREVLIHKTNKVAEDVVQLVVPKTDIKLVANSIPFEICEKCKRRKYSPALNGFIPGFEKPVTEHHIFKCSEYFVAGLDARNRVFISSTFREELRNLKLRPRLWPVDPKYKT